MNTNAINAAIRHMRDALEHVQQARQLVMESSLSSGAAWPKTVIARSMTDGGKFLLDAERELGRMHEWRAAYDAERAEAEVRR